MSFLLWVVSLCSIRNHDVRALIYVPNVPPLKSSFRVVWSLTALKLLKLLKNYGLYSQCTSYIFIEGKNVLTKIMIYVLICIINEI